MKICLPVEQLNGLSSEIAPNFRATPALMIIDLESQQYQGIEVSSSACHATPTHIDAIICAGGIGRGQFNGLRRRGVRVFLSEASTVMEALEAFGSDTLVELHDVECCGGHHHHHPATETHSGGCGCGGADHGRDGSCGCGHH